MGSGFDVFISPARAELHDSDFFCFGSSELIALCSSRHALTFRLQGAERAQVRQEIVPPIHHLNRIQSMFGCSMSENRRLLVLPLGTGEIA